MCVTGLTELRNESIYFITQGNSEVTRSFHYQFNKVYKGYLINLIEIKMTMDGLIRRINPHTRSKEVPYENQLAIIRVTLRTLYCSIPELLAI